MPNQNRKPIMGVSILTLFWIVFPFFPNYGKRLNEFCERRGLKLQLVPLWMMSVRDIEEINPENVISYEDRWDINPSLLKIIWNPFAIIEPLLFGTKSQSEERVCLFHKRFSNAFGVDDTSSDHYLMETSPGNWDQVLEHIQSGGSICLDTWHIRNNSTLSSDCEIGLYKLANIISCQEESIKLIHFQTRSNNELRYFTGQFDDDFLTNAFRALARENLAAPIIIELKPCSIDMLIKVRKQIDSLLKFLNDSKKPKQAAEAA